jgi:hypothetical protein
VAADGPGDQDGLVPAPALTKLFNRLGIQGTAYVPGDNVTTNEDTTRLNMPPLFCGRRDCYQAHPYALREPREVNGAVFPAGLGAWCQGQDHPATLALKERADLMPIVNEPVGTATERMEMIREAREAQEKFVRAYEVPHEMLGLEPMPDAPQYDPGTDEEERQAAKSVYVNEMKLDLSKIPVLGIADDKGNVLLEFRIRQDGTLDARYYEDDLTEAALQFVKHLRRMAGRTGRD